MEKLQANVLFMLDELNASPASMSGTNKEGMKAVIPMLCLHLKLQRHTMDTPAPEIVELPPIHLDPETAAGLPAALLAAIRQYLPQAYPDACALAASAHPDSGNSLPGRH